MLSQYITVVIPCKNEQNYIGTLLDHISEQDNITGTKIVIADANSTDNTLEIILDKKNKLKNLEINIVEGGSVSIARNNGSLLADTPFICFIDADVRFYSKQTLADSLEKALKGYNLITCKLRSYSSSVLSKVAFWLYNKIHRVLILKYPFAIGAYFFVNKNKFYEFGKFSTTSDNSEDFLFSQNFSSNEFYVLDSFIGQDDRRFKTIGYLGMVKHLITNFYKFLKKDIKHFDKKSEYWGS